MQMTKERLKELEEWIKAYNNPVDRVVLADIFYELEDMIEFWYTIHDSCSKEYQDTVEQKDKEIENLKLQLSVSESNRTYAETESNDLHRQLKQANERIKELEESEFYFKKFMETVEKEGK